MGRRGEPEPATGGAGQLIDAHGVTLHVRDEGSPSGGPALVMLHGFLGSTAWFDNLVPWVSDQRVIRIDMLGHGGSERPMTGYAPDEQAAFFEAVLHALDVTNAVAIGHSMEANMAVALAERSTLISGVVILDEGPSQAFATNPPGEALMNHRVIGPVARARTPAVAVRLAMMSAFAKGFRAPDHVLDQCVTDFRTPNHPACTQSMRERAAWAAERGLDDRLRALSQPALVVFGDQDQMFDVASCLSSYRGVPGAQVEVLPGVGHTPMIEAPQQLARLIRDFVTSLPTDS